MNRRTLAAAFVILTAASAWSACASSSTSSSASPLDHCPSGALPNDGDPCDPKLISADTYCRLAECGWGCADECSCSAEGHWVCIANGGACRDDYGCGTPPTCHLLNCPIGDAALDTSAASDAALDTPAASDGEAGSEVLACTVPADACCCDYDVIATPVCGDAGLVCPVNMSVWYGDDCGCIPDRATPCCTVPGTIWEAGPRDAP
ncbi:MAG: hypothetical protein ACHREM_01200 [Polyangiales bacterium]